MIATDPIGELKTEYTSKLAKLVSKIPQECLDEFSYYINKKEDPKPPIPLSFISYPQVDIQHALGGYAFNCQISRKDISEADARDAIKSELMSTLGQQIQYFRSEKANGCILNELERILEGIKKW